MSISAAVTDDAYSRTQSLRFRPTTASSACKIRAAVDPLTHIEDEATTFTEALAREHANILLVAKELERRDKLEKPRICHRPGIAP